MDEEIQEEQETYQPVEDDTTLEENSADDFSEQLQEVEEAGESLEEKLAKLEQDNRRLYARLQKQKEKPEVVKAELKVEPKKPKQENEDIDRLRLEARGFLNEDEQDVILKFSKGLGISAVEAAKDDLITAKIEKMRSEEKTANAIPTPSGKAGSQKHDVDYYISKGEFPDDDEMYEKVQAELVRRGKNNIRITNSND
jgi:hypothetical protein